MGSNRGQHEDIGAGKDHRAPYAEIVCSAAGRCGNNNAVRPIGRQGIAVKRNINLEHARTLSLNRELVDRIRVEPLRKAGTLHLYKAAFLDGKTALKKVVHPAVAALPKSGRRQKPKSSVIDAGNGNIAPAQKRQGPQESAVTAQTEEDVGIVREITGGSEIRTVQSQLRAFAEQRLLKKGVFAINCNLHFRTIIAQNY